MVSPTPSGRDAAATIAARGRVQAPRQTPVVREMGPAVAPLDRFQGTLPRPLRGIPVQALLAGGGLALISVLVGALVLLRSDKAIAALEDEASGVNAAVSVSPRGASAAASSAAAPARPSADDVDAARLAGTAALAALAQRYPDDPAVLCALLVAQAGDKEKKDLAGALRSLRHLLEVAPDRNADKDVQQALVEIANGPPDVAPEAFVLMKTRMGTHGPDLVYDLIQTATGKYAKEHAAAVLADPDLMKAASKPLLVADELRRARPCGRKGLLRRAAAEGDARSLPYLRALIGAKCNTGPGAGIVSLFRGERSDCLSCFTAQDRTAIAAAVEAIEKREKR